MKRSLQALLWKVARFVPVTVVSMAGLALAPSAASANTLYSNGCSAGTAYYPTGDLTALRYGAIVYCNKSWSVGVVAVLANGSPVWGCYGTMNGYGSVLRYPFYCQGPPSGGMYEKIWTFAAW